MRCCLKYYIDNDINTTFQYYRMGAIYYAMAYQEMQHACQVDEIVLDYMNDIEAHEKFLYQTISVGEWELARANAAPCPVIQAILYENYAKAKALRKNLCKFNNSDKKRYCGAA